MDTSKIIKGAVNNGRYTVTAPIVKEDYGLYLQIEGVELPQTYEVDFSNSEHNGTSVTMIGNADGVLIPSQFISSGKDIFAFLYWVGEDYGKTVYKFRIPNKLRPDRTNEEPAPEEQSVIDQAISALNEAVEQTAQDVASADQSARSASADADRAEEARTDAQNYATQAEQAMDDAQTYANNASASATASAQSASEAEQDRIDADRYARASAQSATASANSATTAQGFAQSASASAQSASGYASSAQTSAQTASAKASEASTSASTASQKATEASQSASQALSYKTDAESAKTASQTAQGKAEDAQTAAETAQGLAESARDSAIQAKNDAESAVASINSALIEKAPIITDTASGVIASFTDGTDNLPLKSLVVDINPIQDLSHGDPSPENLCPISGWTQIGVEQRGVNLWDEEWERGDISASTGENAISNTVIRTKNYIPVKPNTQYFAYINASGSSSLRSRFYGINKEFIGIAPKDRASVVYNQTFTTPDNCYYMRFTPQATYGTTYNHDISINYPSTDHSYHPYTGRSITINLGQTVYGGKLDVLSGELVIDRAMVDLGTLDWEYDSTRESFTTRLRFTDAKVSSTVYVPFNAVCSNYMADSSYNTERKANDGTISLSGSNYLRVYDTSAIGMTVAEFKAYLSGVQLCYELATPIEIQLTPQQVNSLPGVNNIWADSGDTEAEYRADTKLFIERLTAPDSADMIADANIQSGKYFMVGNSLYKATANIANGASIIVGTNAVRKSLSEALNEINA